MLSWKKKELTKNLFSSLESSLCFFFLLYFTVRFSARTPLNVRPLPLAFSSLCNGSCNGFFLLVFSPSEPISLPFPFQFLPLLFYHRLLLFCSRLTLMMRDSGLATVRTVNERIFDSGSAAMIDRSAPPRALLRQPQWE